MTKIELIANLALRVQTAIISHTDFLNLCLAAHQQEKYGAFTRASLDAYSGTKYFTHMLTRFKEKGLIEETNKLPKGFPVARKKAQGYVLTQRGIKIIKDAIYE